MFAIYAHVYVDMLLKNVYLFIQSTKIEISKIEMFCVTLNFKIFFALKLHVTLAEGLLTY